MRLGVIFLMAGVGLIALIISLFWLKDRFQNPLLARLAHSEPAARLAVIGGALSVIGILLLFSSLLESGR